MISWWHYLLLVNLYLCLFYGFYRVFLHQETFFQLNRVYLVAAALLSFLIPVMQSDWVRNLFITQRVHQTIYATVNPQFIYQVKPVESNPLTIGQIIATVYIIGAGFLLLRLVYQLLSLKKILLDTNARAAFSFFNQIKVDQSLNGRQTIMEHELVHTRQWHSADVLLIEAVMIVNWFNPVVYLYRKAIKHVHEYIADRKAIETGTSKMEYALLLLSQTFNTEPRQLTNNFFNNSLLKKRIMMLNQNESGRRALLKYGLSAPLFGAMLIFSSATVNNSAIIKVINKKTEQTFSIKARELKDSLNQPATSANLITSSNNIQSQDANDNQNVIKQVVSVSGSELRKDSISKRDNSPVFNAVEIQPNFPGGEEALGRFLQSNIKYPETARENHVQGRVFIQFTVEKDGSLSGFKTLRDPGSGLGEEAVRVLSESPQWIPGTQNGNVVRVQYTVPVNFSLDDAQKKNTDTIRISQTAEKRRKMVLFFRHSNADSVKIIPPAESEMMNSAYTTIKVNGKPVSLAEFRKLNPKYIESINVIKRDTLTKGSGNDAKNMILIIKANSKLPAKS